MTKRVFLLSGLAILAVVLNHAGGYGQIALFLWADRYRAVPVPDWDQLGTLPHYVLIMVRSLGVFAVPAFLFISGFFVAYAARGNRPAPRWKVVKARIVNLLVPYVIWSGIVFIGDALQGITYEPVEYLLRLVTRGANRPLYYVPLLCYFYLLSPLIVPIAKTKWRLLLSVSALIQLGTIVLRYLMLFGLKIPGLDLMIRITPDWSLIRWVFFFALGTVAGLHIQRFKAWLAVRKWGLLATTAVLFPLNILESDVLLRTTRNHWGATISTMSYSLFAIAFILCFLAFAQVSIPFSRTLYQLSKRSYGIYLLHPSIMEFVARVIRQITPSLLAHQILFVTLVFVAGLGIPLLLMVAMTKSPGRRYYRYLFG
jgi:surface polysaccharide O-acyltransferase-like enzyme